MTQLIHEPLNAVATEPLVRPRRRRLRPVRDLPRAGRPRRRHRRERRADLRQALRHGLSAARLSSRLRPLPRARQLVVAPEVAIELRHRERAAPVAGRVDEALVDQARPGRPELLRAPAHHRCDVARRLLLAAELGHRAEVVQLELRRPLGTHAEEGFVELLLDQALRLLGDPPG